MVSLKIEKQKIYIMTKYFSLFVSMIFYTAAFGQQYNLISKKIDSLFDEDQKWRGIIRGINNNDIDTISKEQAQKNVFLTDSLNLIRVREIFYEIGYPTIDKVGEKSSHNFWALVQHADNFPYFQDSVLKTMKFEVEKGNIKKEDYAYLVDRVKVNLGQNQFYGTQMAINKTKDSYEPLPVENPEQLDNRRKEMNLPPIKFYINAMNERYFGTLKKD